MKYSLLLAGIGIFIVVLLYVGYCYLPQRRVFYLFTAIILISTGIIFSFWHGQTKQNVMTEAQKTQILSEQPFFVTWYEEYKQYLEDIDRIWTRYNNTLEDFSKEKIDPDELQQDLVKIQTDSDKLQGKMKDALPPQELSDENYKLSYAVLEETRQYMAAQNDTIKKTLQAVMTPEFRANAFELQRKEIDNIRILNSPVNLNIAGDILTIRDNLSLPDL